MLDVALNDLNLYRFVKVDLYVFHKTYKIPQFRVYNTTVLFIYFIYFTVYFEFLV